MRLTTSHFISFAAGAALCALLIHNGTGNHSTSEENSLNERMAPIEETADSLNDTFSAAGDDGAPGAVDAMFAVRALQQQPGTGGENARAPRVLQATPAKRGSAQLSGTETVECCLKVAEDIDSTMAKRLRDQQSQNPQVFAQQLQMNGQRLMELCALRQADRGLYEVKLQEMKIEAQVLRVGRDLCEAVESNDKDRCAKLEEELRGALQMQLVYEIKSRAEFLMELREHVDKLTKQLDTMGNQFKETVDHRLHQMKSCDDPNNPHWEPEEPERGLEADPIIPPE